MKEFVGYTGGRTALNDDFENLRDLILSFSHLFDDYGEPFIITGCDLSVSDNSYTLSSGYVWLDGKIREVKQTSLTGISNNQTVYISALDSSGTSIGYATKNISGPMSINYSVDVSLSKPSGTYIAITLSNNGEYGMTNTLFNYYALTKDSINEQKLGRPVTLSDATFSSFKFGDDLSATITVSPDNIAIQTYLGGEQKGNKYVLCKNGLTVYSYNGTFLYSLLEGMDKLYLPNITSGEVTTSEINYENDFIIEDKPIEEYLPKFNITDWIPLYAGGKKTSLSFKIINNNIYIGGTVDSSEFTYSYYSSFGGHITRYRTNITIPLSPINDVCFDLHTRYAAYSNISLMFILSGSCLDFVTDDASILTSKPTKVLWHYMTNITLR